MNTTERGGTDRERKSCGKPRSSAIISLHQHPSAFVRCRRWSSLVISGHPHTEIYSPYKGSAPALTDVIAGHVPMLFSDTVPSLPQIKDGKVRALGVSTAVRLPSAPEIPPIAEVGVPGFDAAGWGVIAVPAGTPKEIVSKLKTAL